MNHCLTLCLGLALFTVSSAARVVEPPSPPPAPVALTWTQYDSVQMYVGGNGHWEDIQQLAAAHVEAGYSDWRLPTVAEYQAAFQGGSFGSMTPDVNYWWLWASDKPKGPKAWAVKVVTDASGNVIASQSGQAGLFNKGSFLVAKFVRP